jgi:hypothetical protein
MQKVEKRRKSNKEQKGEIQNQDPMTSVIVLKGKVLITQLKGSGDIIQPERGGTPATVWMKLEDSA